MDSNGESRADQGIPKTAQVADEVRDTINWLAVFKEEYDLPDEVVTQLRARLERIAEML